MGELLLLMAGGAPAGVFGALLGLRGGLLIVPLLTLGFGLPLRDAVGPSLVCVIVTSSAAAAVYLQRDLANLGRALTAGTLAGIALVAAGVAGMAVSRVDPLSTAPRFEPARLPGDLAARRPAALGSLGLLVVIFTAALRVAAALGGYVRGGERRMALTGALILAVIALGVVIGARG